MVYAYVLQIKNVTYLLLPSASLIFRCPAFCPTHYGTQEVQGSRFKVPSPLPAGRRIFDPVWKSNGTDISTGQTNLTITF